MAIVKRIFANKPLSEVHLFVFRQAWLGKTYLQMALEGEYDPNYLREIGSSLWSALTQKLGRRVTKKNLAAIFSDAQPPGPEKHGATPIAVEGLTLPPPRLPHVDWGGAPDVSQFYGRLSELTLLEAWIGRERCRVVNITGMPGIGKTGLAVTLLEEMQPSFDCIVWRSLRSAPLPSEYLQGVLAFLTGALPRSDNVFELTSILIENLQAHRCALVLDGTEAILQPGKRAGRYCEGYEGYGQLLRRIAETPHQSCSIVTGREQLRDFDLIEGSRVQTLELHGLDLAAVKQLFQDRGEIAGTEGDWEHLTAHYGGNPSALKVVATTVRDFCDRDLSVLLAMLSDQYWVMDGIRDLLDPVFDRLSEEEQRVLFWLTAWLKAEGCIPPIAALKPELLPLPSLPDFLGVLDSLRRRSLLERIPQGFTMVPFVAEYVEDRLLASAKDGKGRS